MILPPLRPHETKPHWICRVLADRITSGELAAGSRLRQDFIAQEFDASHVPVREAFLRLEAQGLVVAEPRRGVRVVGFDIAEAREIANMRAVLEGLALRHAIPHLTPAILRAAAEAMRRGDAAQDVRGWEAANNSFHRLILSPCGMKRLLATIGDLQAASARFLLASWRSDWEIPTNQDHRTILMLLQQGRGEDAISALTRHVQRLGQEGSMDDPASQGRLHPTMP